MMKRVKRLSVLAILMILPILGLDSYARAEVVVFPDPALEALIREQIGVPVGDIDESDLESIQILDAAGKGIVDISGISKCVNLDALGLGENAISDISELAELPNLTRLELGENGLENILPLAGLTNLISLSLPFNRFQGADLHTVLSPLVNLVFLDLSRNALTDTGDIPPLPNLERLELAFNQISDISGLENCPKLTHLNLHRNKLTDISPLAQLENLQFVDLFHNDILDFTPVEGVPTVLRDDDSDDDNILDSWETEHFGDLSHDGKDDADSDGLNDSVEFERGTNPNNSDTDGDGMPDGWEVGNRLDPLANDALGDPDGDGITNLQEHTYGTDPWKPTRVLTLLSPEDGAVLTVKQPPTLEWWALGYNEFKVQFSKDSDFPTRKTLTLPSEEESWVSGSSFTPTRREWRSVERIKGKKGCVFWKVKGKNIHGDMGFSETRSLFIVDPDELEDIATNVTSIDQGAGGKDGGDGPCFIATAANGEPNGGLGWTWALTSVAFAAAVLIRFAFSCHRKISRHM